MHYCFCDVICGPLGLLVLFPQTQHVIYHSRVATVWFS